MVQIKNRHLIRKRVISSQHGGNQRHGKQNPTAAAANHNGRRHQHRRPRSRKEPTAPRVSDALRDSTENFREKLAASWDKATFIVFDIETTGGNPERNGITEISAIRYRGGVAEDKFYSLVNPKIPIPPIVRRMTGINNQMVKDAPTIDKVMPDFLAFIADDVLVSHNTIGDMKFVRYFAKKTMDVEVCNFYLCTHLLVEKLVSDAPDKSLKGLAKFFSFEGKDFHRAEVDAHLTQLLLQELIKRLKERKLKHVEQAVRLQGDLESALRLGWGLRNDALNRLPNDPGVFFLYDSEDRLVFLSSALSIAREVKGLKRYHQLPRALLRCTLQACTVQHETSPNNFAAVLAESEALTRHRINLQPAVLHHRQITAFCLIEDPEGGLRINIGPISPGTVAAFGPVRDRKSATNILEIISRAIGVKSNRKGVVVDRMWEPELKSVFSGAGESKFEALQFWKWFDRSYWQKRSQWPELKSAILKELGPTAMHNLLAVSGFIVVPGSGEGLWQIYEVASGRVQFLKESQDPDADLAKARIKPAAIANVSDIDTHQINAVLWWLYTGRKDGRFIEA